jgi:hypothetical protein
MKGIRRIGLVTTVMFNHCRLLSQQLLDINSYGFKFISWLLDFVALNRKNVHLEDITKWTWRPRPIVSASFSLFVDF